MKTPIAAAAVALAATTLLPEALAQGLSRFGKKPAAASSAPVDPAATRTSFSNASQNPTDSTTSTVPNAINAKPLKDGSEIPGPSTEEDKSPPGPTIPLPTGPLEPYLLTKENGPFMVLAYTFRGPEAPRQAMALVLELRNKFKLPAYILLPRKFPNRSNIRGVPPQAPTFATRDDVGVPEVYRTLDEAAVLVGDEKSVKDSNVLLHKVKKLHPETTDGLQQMWHWRKGQGLTRAIMTTNPFIPAESLFPAQQDVLIGKINGGPHTIKNCPGRYSLEIANFSGRKTLDVNNDQRFKGIKSLDKSPLFSAHEDAERLADSLSKDKEIQQTGYEPYVFHDRFSSRVLIGSFNTPDDPAARKLHDKLLELTVDLNRRKVTDNTVIVPAPNLTDLAKIKPQLQINPPLQQVRAN